MIPQAHIIGRMREMAERWRSLAHQYTGGSSIPAMLLSEPERDLHAGLSAALMDCADELTRLADGLEAMQLTTGASE